MAKIQYTGNADTRTINARSWRIAGVEDQNKVEWNKSNNFVQEVSEDAAKFLLALPDFVRVDDDDKDQNEGD